jgi:predicted DNA-binding WGR domain protein
MSEKINTGKYRIGKEIIGQARTKQTVEEFENSEDCKSEFTKIEKADKYTYYMEEETFYRGTQKDADGNPIDTSPGWTRM